MIGHGQGQTDDEARREGRMPEQDGQGAADDACDDAADHRAAQDTLDLRQGEGC